MRGFSFAGCSDMPLTPTLSPQAGEGDHKMSPDLYFAFTLVVKMAVTAVFLFGLRSCGWVRPFPGQLVWPFYSM